MRADSSRVVLVEIPNLTLRNGRVPNDRQREAADGSRPVTWSHCSGLRSCNVMRCDESLTACSGSLEIGEITLAAKACVDHPSVGLVEVACFFLRWLMKRHVEVAGMHREHNIGWTPET